MKDFTDLTFIVDRSGSMSGKEADVKGGFRTFVQDQQKVGDNACLTLVEFDNEYKVVFEAMPIKDVTPEIDYVPRGSTALLDAIGRTINRIGARLAALPESERPNKVIVAVMTDGFENASLEFKGDKIKEMVSHQQDVYKWTFMFLGANIDSFATGGALGYRGQMTSNYDHTKKGVLDGLKAMSVMAAVTRGGVAAVNSIGAMGLVGPQGAQGVAGGTVELSEIYAELKKQPDSSSPEQK